MSITQNHINVFLYFRITSI